ncbi:MAG: YjjG family noncanonical pyrimidine nucleotidase [Clostridia bacterium]|nr:YjjG family noncanonical pyrimidine nucleotidase [Clostridia bacterium]
MYKYLLWDIDGTVLNFLASEAYAIRALFKKYNLGVCDDEMLATYSSINTKYWKMLERNELTKPEILIGRFREFFELIGVDVSIAESFNHDYQLAHGDHIEFVDNAKEMLLSQKGKFLLAAVTNGTKLAQEKKLRLSGLDKIFDHIFISEDIGYEKPNTEFFDHVFASLGITDKSEALIIGDSLTGDIKGGFNSGIDTCWFNPSHKPNNLDLPITYDISDLTELENIV